MADPTNISRAQKLLEEMNAKYGVTSSQPVPQQAQQLAPPPVQIPQQRGLVNDAMSLIKGRQQQIDKASGYACGGKIKGHAQGGLIKGPGTSTSDSIPAKVKDTGENILVSTEERILSKEQDALLGKIAQMMGFESVDQLLESGTGKPVGPTIKGGKRAAEDGLSPWYMKDPATAIASGINASMGSSQSANDYLKKLYPAGTFDTTQSSPTAQPSTQTASPLVSGAIVNQPFAPDKERFPIGSPSQFITGNNGAIPDSSGGGFVAGNKAYTVNPTSQDGIQKVTGGSSPLYTNINPEQAVSGLKNQTIGQPADQAALGITRYENANKIRGEMIANRDKDIPAGGYAPGILGDGGIAADNAEKTQRWRNDELVRQAKNGNQGAIAALMNADSHRDVATMGNETSRQNAGIAAQVANNRDQVTMRGQDINERGDRLRYGNPLDAQAKQLSIAQAQKISQLQEKAVQGDAAAIKELQLRNQKEPNYSNRYISVPGGEETGPDGMTKIKRPSRVFDAQTGQWANDGGQGADQQQAPASAIEFLKKNPNQAEAFKAKYGYIPAGL